MVTWWTWGTILAISGQPDPREMAGIDLEECVGKTDCKEHETCCCYIWLLCVSSINTVLFSIEEKSSTVWCHYNAVNFQQNPHKSHPIACPLGLGMGCNFWYDTDSNSASANAVLYEISCYIGLCYNGILFDCKMLLLAVVFRMYY